MSWRGVLESMSLSRREQVIVLLLALAFVVGMVVKARRDALREERLPRAEEPAVRRGGFHD